MELSGIATIEYLKGIYDNLTKELEKLEEGTNEYIYTEGMITATALIYNNILTQLREEAGMSTDEDE